MNKKITTGERLRAWRKSIPLKLQQLSRLIKVSQGSLSDLENDKSLPSATTLKNLSIYSDLNIYWLLTGKGPISRKLNPDIDKSTELSQLYEDFMFMMQDRKLKAVTGKVIDVYRKGSDKKKTKIEGFLLAL